MRKGVVLHTGRSWEVVRGKPVAALGLVNGWMALAPDGMERSGRFSRYHLPTTGKIERMKVMEGGKGGEENRKK